MPTHRCADLNVEATNRIPVVHGVEGGDLVDAHGRHLQHTCDLIHNADACESVLSLSQVQDGHHSGFLVLGGVSAEDLFDELIVLFCELERNRGVVDRRIAVLHPGSAR
jgi:hypothetical protein